MFCTKCQKDLSGCTCPDLEERLGDSIVYRQCKVCGKHYARCKCVIPIWTTNLGDQYLPKEFREEGK
jgi:tRNA G26 N,N-dimethylase Trm1